MISLIKEDINQFEKTYLQNLAVYTEQLSLKGLTPSVIPDDITLADVYVRQNIVSSFLKEKPQPVLYNKDGLAVIDAAFPLPQDEGLQRSPGQITAGKIHRIVSCLPGAGATTFMKTVVSAIINKDIVTLAGMNGNGHKLLEIFPAYDNVVGRMGFYEDGHVLLEYLPVFIDALAFSEESSLDSQIYTMVQALFDTGLTQQQFESVVRNASKPLLFIDNCDKLPFYEKKRLLMGLKDSSYKEFFLSLSPAATESVTVMDCLLQFPCLYDIAVDNLYVNAGQLVNSYSALNHPGPAQAAGEQSVRNILWRYSPGDTTARFILQVYLQNSAHTLTNFELNGMYFTNEFPNVFRGIHLSADDVLTLMPYLAGAMAESGRELTRSMLKDIIAQVLPHVPLNEDSFRGILHDLIETGELLEEISEGLYLFRFTEVFCYFGAISLIDRKGISLNRYLGSGRVDYTLLTDCIRYAYTRYSTYMYAEKIIDFAYGKLKSYADRFPDMMRYFDLEEEMPDETDGQSAFGSHVSCLLTALKEYSPLVPKDKAYGIYSLVFQTMNSVPPLKDFFDPVQCYLTSFCLENSNDYPQHRARAYGAALIRQGKDVYYELINLITAEKAETDRQFLVRVLTAALKDYSFLSVFHLYNHYITSDFIAFVNSCEGQVYRDCAAAIEEKLMCGRFYKTRLSAEEHLRVDDCSSGMDLYRSGNFPFMVDNLIKNSGEYYAEDSFVETPLTDISLSHYHNVERKQLEKLHNIYAPKLEQTSNRRMALRYFKILALTGYWEDSRLIDALYAIDRRFSADPMFSWDGIGAETIPAELAFMENRPAIITYSSILRQLENFFRHRNLK